MPSNKTVRFGGLLTALVFIPGLLSVALGLCVLIGWHTRITALIQVLPAFAPMQYNTAVGFILCGAALLSAILGRRVLGAAVGLVAVVIGMLTLAEYVFSVDLGIDQLLMDHYLTVKTSHPGRMAPNTAVCFVLIGLVPFWGAIGRRWRYRSEVFVILGSLAFGLSTIAMSGYLIDIETAYGWGQLTRMAFHTALGFMVLSPGTLSMAWRLDLSHDGILPKWLPIPICVGMLTMTVCFWQAIEAEARLAAIKGIALQGHSRIADILLFVGVILAVATAFAIYQWQISLRRSREINKVNRSLVDEINLHKQARERIENLAKFPSENPNPVLRIAKDGEVLYSNHAGELLLSKWKTGIGRTAPEKWRNLIARAFASGESIVEEEVEGKIFSLAITPLKEAGYANFYGRDITERKRAEEEVRLNESRLESLVVLGQMASDSLQDITDFALEEAIRLTGSTIGYLSFMNEDETILTMHSGSKTGMAGCQVPDKPYVYSVESTGLWGEAVRQRKPIITNDYGAPNPFKKGYPKGHARVTRHMNIPVFDGDSIVVVAGVGNKKDEYDKTDVRQLTLLIEGMWRLIQRKRAEEQREELVKTLEYKNTELQDIVYTASHDLRSPLVNIEGFSGELESDCCRLMELLVEQAAGADKREQIEPLIKENIPESLGFITGSAKKMSSLLDGLLQISRIGTVKINSESLDINRIVREILAAMQHQISQSNAAVTVDSLPGCIGDLHMLDHVLTNLISNAIKYLDPAKKREIKITGKVEDGLSIYCVEDNGIGIAPGHQRKVFEIFHRLSPEGSVSGEGLGLTIVTRILDRLGGKIRLESKEGHGSKFFVSLPTV